MRSASVAVTLLLATIAAVVTPSALASWSWSYDIERDPIDQNYVNAYLTWRSGKGALSWTPTNLDEDWANPAPDQALAEQRAKQVDPAWQARTHLVSPNPFVIPVDEFVSDPVPQALHLNVSRGISLDLYQKSGNCPVMELELWMGDRLVAGSIADVRQINNKFYYSPPRPGACGHPFGLHAEVDVIPAGSVLTLKLIQFEAPNPIYALNDWNVIRFPIYSPEELAFRQSDAGTPVDSEEEEEPAKKDLRLLGLAALPPLAIRRHSRRASLVLLLLLAPALAGCLSSPGATTGDSPPGATQDGEVKTTIVPVENQTGENGSIVGFAHDDYNVPIAGAHVSLLGSSLFTGSNNHGQFTLKNVPPATYRMRFDRSGYHSYEVDVTVAPASITRLDVTLIPLVAKSAGERAHRHDYWAPGETSRKIFEGPVSFATSSDPSPACKETSGTQNLVCFKDFLIPSDADDRNLILPGTKDIEIKIRWDAGQVRTPRAGILYTANDNTSQILMYPRQSGASTHIQVDWGMNDYGHQTYTSWRFAVYLASNSNPQRPTYQSIGAPLTVEVTIHRGVVPLEPGHFPRWGNETQLMVLDKASLFASETCCPARPNQVVPVGTEYLSIVLEPSRATKRTPVLTLKPANVQPGTNYDDRAPKPLSSTPTRIEYRYDLQAGEADPFYAQRSLWEFGIVWKGDDLANTLDTAENYAGRVKLALTVIAFKDPAYVEGESG